MSHGVSMACIAGLIWYWLRTYGSLGSRRTHAARLKRLRELGHGDAALARIQGPVGLNIEAVTAPEIALSIIAEIVAVRRGAQVPQKQAA